MTSIKPDLLAGLTDEEAEALMALGKRRTLGSGEALFRLGMEADALYLIERGRIALTLPMHFGDRNEDVLIEERGPGQTLGWSALIPPNRFTLNATAQVTTELIALPRGALLAHLSAHSDAGSKVAMNVAATIGQRLQVFQAMWLREMQRTVNVAHA